VFSLLRQVLHGMAWQDLPFSIFSCTRMTIFTMACTQSSKGTAIKRVSGSCLLRQEATGDRGALIELETI
jgi:hypothetical protein